MLALEEYWGNRRNTRGILALEEYLARNARKGGIFEESSPCGDVGEYLRGPRIGGRLGEECSHRKNIGGVEEILEETSHWRNIRGILALSED
jgi:hypothetical protein